VNINPSTGSVPPSGTSPPKTKVALSTVATAGNASTSSVRARPLNCSRDAS
jgi:hypothetical protein